MSYAQPIQQRTSAPEDGVPVGAAMVVGGGIAGIQAALDLADSDIQVYLVEKGPTLGGRMAQLDKTFPTNDCAICILSPKLVEAARHPNIEILTNTELLALEGEAGNFTVRLRQHPRYVSTELCTSCDDCTKVCPIEVPKEFDEGLSRRKAIYRPYAQAIPSTYLVTKRGTSPCKNACPAGTSAQGYIALLLAGRYEDALEVVRQYNPFPATVGRVCNHPCETQCSRGQVDEPVAICALKRFVADTVYAQWDREGRSPEAKQEELAPFALAPQELPPPERRKVAVVGAGPAGLSAAYFLARMGYTVTVFEALPVAGGMMRVGIPPYRLPREVLDREIREILRTGVRLELNHPVRNINALLEQGFAAVFLAIGAHEAQRLGIPGEDVAGVFHGVPFLRSVNLGEEVQLGRRVVVVGGGNTAIDTARTALRLGSEEVILLYRRSQAEMPANPWELEQALEEGAQLQTLTQPIEVLSRDGHITGLRCIRMQLGEPDASGRRRPVPIPGSEFELACDTMVAAVAQAPEISFLDPDHGLEVTARGTFRVDPQTLATNRPGIFAGGDAASGPAALIEAIAAGRRGALSIDRYLRDQPLLTPREVTPLPVATFTPEEMHQALERGEAAPRPRARMAAVSPAERISDFREVELGLSEEQALAEAARCLRCGLCSECYMCVLACKAHAIDHQQAPVEREIHVGALLLAPGYTPYPAKESPELGWGRYANVLTSLQFERMLSASGPTRGHLVRPSDGKEPRRIAFIQCVGSRDEKHDYCSSVCCMYATKEAMLALEHAPGVECTIFQMDMRAFSKGFDAYYQRAQSLGVRYVRNRVSELKENPATRDIHIRYAVDDGKVGEESFDLVVLSLGMEPPEDAQVLSETLGIHLDGLGFCAPDPALPVATNRPGIFACGTFTGPKDIPETVVEAGGAAGAALAEIGTARNTLVQPRVYPPEMEVTPQEQPRVGVFVCSCGNNIAGVVNVSQVVEYARRLPDVVYAENTIYTCSPDSLARIQEAIREHRLNRLIVASCTPRTHEPIFRDTARQAGMNPFLFEMANIRDQCSWVHPHEPEKATDKAKDLVRMAVARSRLLAPLHTRPQSLQHTALVIGGGIAGMTAALNLARQGFGVYLVERESRLGGQARRLGRRVRGGDPSELVQSLEEAVRAEERIEVLLRHQPVKTEGFVGNFRTWVQDIDSPRQRLLEHGVTIVATGAQEYRGSAYGLGQHPRVLTQGDLDALLAGKEPQGVAGPLPPIAELKDVAMLLCVGPWDEMDGDQAEGFYCSRICCATAMKNAIALKEANPDTQVTVLYNRDIRTYGRLEALYTQARRLGVLFVRYPAGERPRLSLEGDRPILQVTDTALNQELHLEPDLLVLSAATLPAQGHRDLAEMFKFSCTLEGFFLEAHVKLQPVDFPSEGLFLAGMCHYPKLIEEAQTQALAAAARAARILSKEHLEVGGVVAVVEQHKCTGCLTCVRICPFGAVRINHTAVGAGGILGAAEVEAAACRGCGICAGECPAKAIQLEHFRDDQVLAKVEALLLAPV